MSTFRKDLEKAKIAEKEALRIIQKKYPKAHKREGYCKGYDIVIPELDITIEVKFDLLYKTYGNLFIENTCNNKPSGIETTTAYGWWIFYDEDDLSKIKKIKTKTLREMIKNNNYTNKFGGESDNKTTGYTIPIGEFK